MSTFEKEYWKANYSEPQTMDCIGNAKQHAKYMRALFTLEFIDISTVIDLGFGLGYLFKQVLKEFMPYRATGIEPSLLAFNQAQKRKLQIVDSMKLSLYNESIEDWCLRADSSRLRFDLGVCTSVFQYLGEDILQLILPVIAKRVKYLYLTVPTDIELMRQREELSFNDEYAIARSREFYFQLLSTHFTLVANKVWESKLYFDEESTHFSDLLYRV